MEWQTLNKHLNKCSKTAWTVLNSLVGLEFLSKTCSTHWMVPKFHMGHNFAFFFRQIYSKLWIALTPYIFIFVLWSFKKLTHVGFHLFDLPVRLYKAILTNYLIPPFLPQLYSGDDTFTAIVRIKSRSKQNAEKCAKWG